MFERYREDTRRAIYFADWEARQSSSTYIEPQHILLALTHDATSKANDLFNLTAYSEDFRKDLGLPHPVPERTREAVDVPLSNAGKRVLAYTAEEADRLVSTAIGTEHLLLGLLRGKESKAAVALAHAGIDLHSARNRVKQDFGGPSVEQVQERKTDRGTASRKSLRPFAAFFLLVIVLSLIYLIVRLVNF
jgi:ATP-dependent Clp protease ATP-binding subunit ClpC